MCLTAYSQSRPSRDGVAAEALMERVESLLHLLMAIAFPRLLEERVLRAGAGREAPEGEACLAKERARLPDCTEAILNIGTQLFLGIHRLRQRPILSLVRIIPMP